jgi:crescentin
MNAISRLFVRKQPALPLPAAEPHLPDQPAADAWAELGLRVGGDNEALRNLLTDVGRRIDALDDLRDIFGRLVTPIDQALESLERETFENINLRNSLDEASANYESLRTEYKEICGKLAVSEDECERAREELGLSQHAASALEDHKIELTNELEEIRPKVAKLERQLAREAAAVRILNNHKQSLTEQAAAADKRIAELETAIGSTREKLVLRDDENRSLQTSLDQMVGDNSRMSRRLAENESMIEKMRSQLEQMQAMLKAAEVERSKLAAAIDEVNDRRQVEINTLSTRLEAMSSRAITAEKLLSDVRQTLLARTEESSTAERKAVEATLTRTLTDKKLELAQNSLQLKERQLQELEHSRSKLVERANTMLKTVKLRETALTRAEEQIQSLVARLTRVETEAEESRSEADESIAELKAQLQNERAGRTVAEGALKKARISYAELPREADDFAHTNRAAKSKGPARERSQIRPVPKDPLLANRPAQSAAKDLPVVQTPIRTAPEDVGPAEGQKAPTVR